MKRKQLLISLCLINFFILFTSDKIYSQINRVWDDIFDVYWDSKLACDKLGNCYMQYYVFGAVTDSIKLAKYNSYGQKLWDKVVYTDTILASNLNFENFYIDDLNFPIIQFTSEDFDSSEYFLLKCDTAGNFLWKTETEVSQNCSFFSGDIYFSGKIAAEMLFYKYDADGLLQYKTSRPFVNGGSYGAPPLVDPFKNAYCYYVDTVPRIYKLDSTGIVIDSLFLSFLPSYTIHFPILDSQNNLLFAFYVNDSTGSAESLKVRKYDSSLNLIWETDAFTFGECRKMVTDYSDNIYIESIWQFDSSLPLEFKIVKLNQNGTLQWIRNFGTIGGLTKYYDTRILVAPDNNVIVVGEYYPNGNEPLANTKTDKFFIAQLDSAGVLYEYEEFTGNEDLNIGSWPSLFNYNIQFSFKYSLTDQTHIFDFCTNCTNILSGYVFFDTDSSCTFDSLEIGLNNAVVEILPDSQFVMTDSAGMYHAYLYDNNYDITSLPYQSFQNACGANTQNITINNSIPVENVNFGKYLNPNINDLFINIGRGMVRPGFNTLFVLNYQNLGGSIQSGVINFIPESFFTFVQSSAIPTFPGGDTIQWAFSNLLPGESRNFNVILNTPISNPLGAPFENNAIISSQNSDINPADNYAIDQSVITGSWDPNNKTVIPVGIGSEGFITTNDSILHYTINFENYGNDTAFTVIVIDTLDQDLDVSTLIIGSVSHAYTVELLHSKILRFRFNNIMLTDTSNLNQNYGFINYSIEQKSFLPEGTEITNSADIYFDYNLPIKTPLILNTIFEPTGLNEIANDQQFNVYPNPVEHELQIDIKNPLLFSNISLYDIKGELIYGQQGVFYDDITINMNNYNQGIYILRLQTSKTTFFHKIIKL